MQPCSLMATRASSFRPGGAALWPGSSARGGGALGAPLMAAFSALRTSLFVGGGEGRGEEVGGAVAVARCCALCSIVLSSLWSPPLWHCRSPAGDELGDWIDDVRACTWHCGGIPVLGHSNWAANTACPRRCSLRGNHRCTTCDPGPSPALSRVTGRKWFDTQPSRGGPCCR